MSASTWIRQFHRWVSMLFTATIILIFAMLGTGNEPAQWVYYVPLPPLFLLLFSGLYLFALPYVARRRAARRQP